nr:hypothetical protein [uncultured Agathobaculum sp.]
MKRVICLLLAAWIAVLSCACGASAGSDAAVPAVDAPAVPGADEPGSAAQPALPEAENSPAATAPAEQERRAQIDVDLTEMSSTMVFAEVYNMMVNPEQYIGKTIKMKGMLDYSEDPETREPHFACVIADATACCARGVKFIPSERYTTPEDYPEPYTEITIRGTFEVYGEGIFQYFRIADAEWLDVPG